jgi:hypothetical protein
MRRRLLSIAVSLACGLTWSGTAVAVTGDVVATRALSQCPTSYVIPHFFLGVGIAFDGRNLWYSCVGARPDLFRADPATGAVTASYDVDGGLGALAYDARRNALWAAPGVGANQSAIQLIQLDARRQVTGARVAFGGPGGQLDAGLAYDASDDSLYVGTPTTLAYDGYPVTPDTIAHYATSGALLGSSPAVGGGCHTAGLAIGGAVLYEASVLYLEGSACSRISAASKADPSTAAFDFAGAGGIIPADVECDPVTFAPADVIWEVSTYELRRAAALEVPAGSCGLGGERAGRQRGRAHRRGHGRRGRGRALSRRPGS